MISPLVSTQLMKVLEKHFNTIATVWRAVTSYNADNEEIITFPAHDPTIGSIRCYVERLQNSFVGEFRQSSQQAKQIVFTDAFTIALNGYYPTISQNDQLRLDSGVVHNIMRVEHDDSKTYTTLVTEIVNQEGM